MYAILRDFMQINLYEDDFEMKADLYLRIAQGYTHAPDLRATWLEGLRFVRFRICPSCCSLSSCLLHSPDASVCFVCIRAAS